MTNAPASVVSLVLAFPPKGLSPNARLDRWAKAKQAAAYRQGCRVDAQNVRLDMERQGMAFPLAAPVTAIVTFVLTSARQRRDWTNLIASFKAGEDGLVDAGLLSDDCIQVIGRVGYEWALGQEEAVRVRLEGGRVDNAGA